MQNESAQSTVVVNGEQAKAELSVLETRAQKLKTALIEANKAGDGTAYNKLSKELKATQKEMNQLAKESFDVKKVLDNLSGASMRDLEKAQTRLKAQLRSPEIQRNSKDWKELTSQLKKVKEEQQKVNSEMNAGATSAEKFSGGFRQMFAGAIAGIAALTGVYMALKKFMDLRMQLEDSQANLKALTGLGDTDIKWLTNYAKELSTTTTEAGVRITASSKEIMDGFTVIGSKRPELLKNKEAMAEVTKEALILAAAGKMDVKEAFEAVTASMNQFNLEADQSRRIINVLGAGALEGSAEINDLSGSMKNVGTVAANSNMTLEQTIAALEVLASKQLLGEEAGTKLRGVLLKMKEAGVGYVSGAFNMRDAIVEINEKLKDKGTALERDAYMQKVFGIENITAGMILLDNVDSYDKLTKAITGTTVAEKQAQINTDTTSAKLKQATNNFNEAGMALVTNLEPAMLTTVNAGVKIVNLFVKYPALAIAIISALGLLTFAYLANTVAMMANALWTKLLAEATALANTRTIMFFRTLMSNPYVAAATAIAGIVLVLTALVNKTKEAMTVQSEHNKIMDEANKKTGEEEITLNSLRKILNDSTKSYTERKNALDEIQKIVPEYHAELTKEGVLINNNTEALDLYVQKLKVSAQMQLATTNLVNAQDEQRKYIENNKEALLEIMKIRMKANELMASGKYEDMDHALAGAGLGAGYKGVIAGLDEINNKVEVYDKLVNQYAGDLSKIKPRVVKPEKNTVGGGGTPEPEMTDLLAGADKWIVTEQNKFKERHLKGLDSEEIYQKNLVNVMRAGLVWKMNLYEKGSKEYLDFKGQIDDIDLKRQDDAEKTSQKALKTLQDGRLNAIVLYDNAQREELNQNLEDETISQDSYNNSILALDMALAEARVFAAKQHADDIKNFRFKSDADRIAAELEVNKEIETADKNLTDAQKAILKKSISDRKQIAKEVDDLEKKYGIDEKKSKNKEYKEALSELKTKYEAELLLYENDAKKKAEITKRYEKDISKVKLKQAEQTAKDISEILSAATQLSSALQESETMAVDNKYAKQLNAAKKAGQDTTALEAQIEEEKKAIKKKYADLDFAISVAKITADTAGAIMKALDEMGPIAGPIAAVLIGATGLAQIAVANEQRQAVANLWTGGFTPPGDKYKPTGVVHAGEFVANQDAVRSAPLRKVFNLVDYAQRTNTIARIDNEAIARALSIKQGYAGGGYVGTAGTAGQTVNIDMSAVVATMQQTNAVNAELLRELKSGIKAKYTISGNFGVKKGLDEYESMIKNATR